MDYSIHPLAILGSRQPQEPTDKIVFVITEKKSDKKSYQLLILPADWADETDVILALNDPDHFKNLDDLPAKSDSLSPPPVSNQEFASKKPAVITDHSDPAIEDAFDQQKEVLKNLADWNEPLAMQTAQVTGIFLYQTARQCRNIREQLINRLIREDEVETVGTTVASLEHIQRQQRESEVKTQLSKLLGDGYVVMTNQEYKREFEEGAIPVARPTAEHLTFMVVKGSILVEGEIPAGKPLTIPIHATETEVQEILKSLNLTNSI